MPIFFHRLYTDGIHPDARFPRTRYVRLASRLREGHTAHAPRIEEAPRAERAHLLLAHDGAYVDRFLGAGMDAKEMRRIGLRPWTPELIPRTLHIMGGALAALRCAVASGGLAGNMAGGTHHAHRDFGSGYCVFNDLAICARYAQRHLDVRRVLILDLDVHQGDGTATIFARDPDVMTVSVHCAANFPFRKAESDRDFPVPAGTVDAAYLPVVDQAIEVGLSARPELVLFQAGVDALAADALGRLDISRGGMRARNRRVFDACRDRGLPCVVFMGGGYANPLEPTLDAFEDLFWDAAESHARRMGGRVE